MCDRRGGVDYLAPSQVTCRKWRRMHEREQRRSIWRRTARCVDRAVPYTAVSCCYYCIVVGVIGDCSCPHRGVARSLQEKELASAVAVSHSAMRSIESNRRAFYRQLKKVVEKADVILVVLDARDPMVRRTRCLCK